MSKHTDDRRQFKEKNSAVDCFLFEVIYSDHHIWIPYVAYSLMGEPERVLH